MRRLGCVETEAWERRDKGDKHGLVAPRDRHVAQPRGLWTIVQACPFAMLHADAM